MKTPQTPDRDPKSDPMPPQQDPGQQNPRPPNWENPSPSDKPRPGTDPSQPID